MHGSREFDARDNAPVASLHGSCLAGASDELVPPLCAESFCDCLRLWIKAIFEVEKPGVVWKHAACCGSFPIK